MIPELVAVQAGLPDVGRRGNEDWDTRLGGVFAAQGEDEWLAASASTPGHVAALRHLLGVRGGSDEALQQALARWSATRPAAEAAARLQEAGLPAGRVQDARGLLNDPHLRARGFLEAVDMGPPTGARWLIGRPYRWHRADVRIRRRAPHYGEDNDAVIGDPPGTGPRRSHACATAKSSPIVHSTRRGCCPRTCRRAVAPGTIKAFDPAYRAQAPGAAQVRHRSGDN